MHFLAHFFLPHQSNNYRAKILHNKSLLFILVFLFLFQFAVFALRTTNPDILGKATQISIDELLQETNRERAENGFPTLSLNEELSLAAGKKAQDMFARDYWAHNAPDGTTPWVFIKEANYTYSFAGENLAKDFSYSPDVVKAWMNSSRHRDNVLSENYEDIGFAIMSGKLNGRETTLIVQMFGKRAGSYIARGEIEPESATTISASSSSNKQSLVHGVTRSPLFDVSIISRNLAASTGGMLIFILAIDLMIMRRRKIVRLTGHNVDHILFLSGPIIISLLREGGAIL